MIREILGWLRGLILGSVIGVIIGYILAIAVDVYNPDAHEDIRKSIEHHIFPTNERKDVQQTKEKETVQMGFQQEEES